MSGASAAIELLIAIISDTVDQAPLQSSGPTEPTAPVIAARTRAGAVPEGDT